MHLLSQPSLVWISQYNGTAGSNDLASSVCFDDSGNVYVTGKSYGGSSLNYDYATIKYNSKGIQQWVARYNGPGNGEDNAVAICADKIGNIYVTGSSKGSGSNNLDFATIKYDNFGNERWVVRYNSGTSNDNATGMCIDSSGYIYVTGRNNFLRTIKYDSSGAQLWIASYDGPSSGINHPNVIINDKFGNIIVAGYSDLNYLTVKYNSEGIQQWVATYNGPSNATDYIQAIDTDFAGNVIVTGTSNSSSPDWMTIKYNPDGNVIWTNRNQRSIPDSYDYARDIFVDNIGDVYVTGSQTDVIKSGSYMMTYKYDSSNGAVIWSRRFDNLSSADFGVKIIGDALSNIIVLCSSSYFLGIKYSPTGQLLWNSIIGGFESYSAMISDNEGNLFITGGLSSNYVTLKYNDIITGIATTIEIPKGYLLKQNYPNPFNPKTIINYELQAKSYVSLKVYDVLGNEISSLVNQKQNAGSYSIEFDGKNSPSGIYFYKIVAGDFTSVKRMILVK